MGDEKPILKFINKFTKHYMKGFAMKNVKGETIIGEPKCPGCNVIGVDYFKYCDGINPSKRISENFPPPFIIVFCDKCGHVYNVIPYLEQKPYFEGE